jgi:hypothetical protein
MTNAQAGLLLICALGIWLAILQAGLYLPKMVKALQEIAKRRDDDD